MSCDTPNWKIRNLEGGFIYAVKDVTKPHDWARVEAQLGHVYGMDYFAADVMSPTTANSNTVYQTGTVCLEINTAPGLESPTVLDFYAEHLRGYLR